MKRVRLEGSERTLAPGAVPAGKVNPRRRIEVTVMLRGNGNLEGHARAIAAAPVARQNRLSRQQFADAYGASDSDIRAVERFARRFRIRRTLDATAAHVAADERALRTVELRGTVRAFSRAFRVHIRRFRTDSGSYRGYEGSLQVPDTLKGIIRAVEGLDNRKAAKPFSRQLKPLGGSIPLAGGKAYFPGDVGKIYKFPADATGRGQTIAIIELGGGYRRRDLTAYFQQIGISTPIVTSVGVGRAANAPVGDPNSDDAEVMLDIEVAGALAPAAKIVVYFASNTSRGFLRAINTAINDNVNKPAIVSISWGAPESSWPEQTISAMNDAFKAAAALGVTVCVAAGDGGSSDGVSGHLAHTDFPASSPWVLACGGTQLTTLAGARKTEVVWNDGPGGGATGGGISGAFPLPDYQSAANVPASVNPGGAVGRGVPDVAGNASPVTGYRTRVDGQDAVIGGTSAVAPLWAGLVALLNEKLGQNVGFLNPLLYKSASAGALFDIVNGNNDEKGDVGGYAAAPGWDPCTGLGVPDGEAILNSLSV